MVFISRYETEREVMMIAPTDEERVLKESLPLHLATVYDANDNEDMVFYHVYAKDWKDVRHYVGNHFEKNFPKSSDAYCWTVDSVEIN